MAVEIKNKSIEGYSPTRNLLAQRFYRAALYRTVLGEIYGERGSFEVNWKPAVKSSNGKGGAEERKIKVDDSLLHLLSVVANNSYMEIKEEGNLASNLFADIHKTAPTVKEKIVSELDYMDTFRSPIEEPSTNKEIAEKAANFKMHMAFQNEMRQIYNEIGGPFRKEYEVMEFRDGNVVYDSRRKVLKQVLIDEDFLKVLSGFCFSYYLSLCKTEDGQKLANEILESSIKKE